MSVASVEYCQVRVVHCFHNELSQHSEARSGKVCVRFGEEWKRSPCLAPLALLSKDSELVRDGKSVFQCSENCPCVELQHIKVICMHTIRTHWHVSFSGTVPCLYRVINLCIHEYAKGALWDALLNPSTWQSRDHKKGVDVSHFKRDNVRGPGHWNWWITSL